MANYNTLKAAIEAVIRTNGNEEITGAILQDSLIAMINSLGLGYQYLGVATPATNPGTPDQNVFYLAATAGTYTNFGGVVLADGELAILKYNGSWTKEDTGIDLVSVSQNTLTIGNNITGIQDAKILGLFKTTREIIAGRNNSVYYDFELKSGEKFGIKLLSNSNISSGYTRIAYQDTNGDDNILGYCNPGETKIYTVSNDCVKIGISVLQPGIIANNNLEIELYFENSYLSKRDKINLTNELPISGNYTLATAIVAANSIPFFAKPEVQVTFFDGTIWNTYIFHDTNMSRFLEQRWWIPKDSILPQNSGFIKPDGTIGVDSNYRYSDYLNVKALKGSKLHLGVSSTGVAYVSFYDNNRNFLSALTGSGTYDVDFDTLNTNPNNAFVRICCTLTSVTGYGYIYNISEEQKLAAIPVVDNNRKHITFSNALKSSLELTPQISQLDSSGNVVTDIDLIGTVGNVTKINLGIIDKKKLYIKFKFKVNENINILRNDLDYTGNDCDLLNIFKFSCRYHQRMGFAPMAFTQRNSFTQNNQTITAPYAKVQGNTEFASVWDVRTKQKMADLDGWINSLFVGPKLFGVRYIGSDYATLTNNLFLKNDGTSLVIHNGDNTINYSFTLSSYSNLNELVTALKANTNLEITIFGSLDRTPTDMAVFDDICIVNTRSNVASNDIFIVYGAVNEEWHTFEWMVDRSKYSRPIAQIDGIGGYVNFLCSDIFNATTPAVAYIGGTDEGSNITMEYKDIDIRIVDTLDAELLINETSGFSILSDETPRVMVYTMHNVSDDISPNVSDTYTTPIDKLYWVFNLAKKKGYSFITINDLCAWVKGSKKLPRRSILFVNDDIRLYLYLNRKILSAYTHFGVPLTLALQNNSETFEYNDITYQVKDLIQRMRGSHFDVVSHSDHTDSPNTMEDWEIWKANFARSENLQIDDTIHVYVGGNANPMFCDELEDNGVKIGLTTTKGVVRKLGYGMRVPRYYVDNVESLNALKNEII